MVDTEEEFDWNAPFSRTSQSVGAIADQYRAQDMFDRLAIKPIYVVDYPIASSSQAVGILKEFRESGVCDIGAHLHPWVSPPFEEEVTTYNSYHGNLPPALEREKLLRLTDAIVAAFEFAPTIFKAGRYGLGPTTLRSVAEAGYDTDCSVVPFTTYGADGGPTFHGLPDQPYWTSHGILELPLTRSFIGAAPFLGERFPALFDAKITRTSRMQAALAKSGITERVTLTPEGMTLEKQQRLLLRLVSKGHKIFTLTYHSTSLGIGNTPYVRNEHQREELLDRLEALLCWARDTLSFEYSTVADIRAKALKNSPQFVSTANPETSATQAAINKL